MRKLQDAACATAAIMCGMAKTMCATTTTCPDENLLTKNVSRRNSLRHGRDNVRNGRVYVRHGRVHAHNS
jgi:hypothetical protein